MAPRIGQRQPLADASTLRPSNTALPDLLELDPSLAEFLADVAPRPGSTAPPGAQGPWSLASTPGPDACSDACPTPLGGTPDLAVVPRPRLEPHHEPEVEVVAGPGPEVVAEPEVVPEPEPEVVPEPEPEVVPEPDIVLAPTPPPVTYVIQDGPEPIVTVIGRRPPPPPPPVVGPAPPLCLPDRTAGSEGARSPGSRGTGVDPRQRLATARERLASARARLDDVRTRRTVAAAVAAALLAVALGVVSQRSGASAPVGSDGSGAAPPAEVAAIDPALTRVARAVFPLVDVYTSPTDAEPRLTLEHPTPSGAGLVFVALRTWEDWLEVMVPSPPAGQVGWIRTERVELSDHQVQIRVDLEAHVLEARDGGRVVMQVPVAVGHHDAPDPGMTFVTQRLTDRTRAVGYGTHTLVLAGYPNGADAIFRGSGLVAIHGVGDPLLVGLDVTRGSIGLTPEDMERLFEVAPVGTPVEVVAGT